MKHNIKNFPKCGHLDHYCSWCLWREGFEKELREELAVLDMKLHRGDHIERILKIKEILGETQP